jgi:hypothetical protein
LCCLYCVSSLAFSVLGALLHAYCCDRYAHACLGHPPR